MVQYLECLANEPRGKLNELTFFELLTRHKQAESDERHAARDHTASLAGNASNIMKFLNGRFRTAIAPVAEKRVFVERVRKAIQAGRLDVQRLKKISGELSKTNNPDEMIAALRTHIPESFLRDANQPQSRIQTGYDGVVLAEFVE